MKLDVIIPAFNEAGNLVKLHEILSDTLKDIKYNLIFVDDGSIDKTYERLQEIYDKDKNHVKVISFSRNFGKDAAMYAGMKYSTAEYACIIDSDLQQNPKHLIEMLKFLEDHEEYDQIAMVNDYSNDKKMSRFLKKSFYNVMNKASEQSFRTGASDFRMFRHYVVEAICSMGESNRFSKGLFSWVGFKTYYMPYTVERRFYGESKFKLKSQIKYAWTGILNFSTKPLKISTLLGTIISSGAFLYLLVILFQTLIFGKDIPGYASLMCVILLLGGIQLLVLGIIGEYIAKSYMEVKARPVYIAKRKLGFDDEIL